MPDDTDIELQNLKAMQVSGESIYELPDEPEQDTTGLYEVPPPVRDTEMSRNRLSVYDAITKSLNEGGDIVQLYTQAQSKSGAQIKSDMAQDELLRKTEDISRYVDETLDSDISSFGKLVNTIPGVNELNTKESESAIAPELALVDSMHPGVGDVDPDMRERLANNLYFHRFIQESWDEFGLSDVAGLLLLPDESYDTSQVVGEFFNSAEGWKRFIAGFHTMDPSEQRKNFPHIKAALTEAFDGNQLKVMIKLMELLDPDVSTEVNIAQTIDKAVVLGTLAAIAKGVRKLYKAAGVVKAARDMRSQDLAAAMSSDAVSSPAAAKAVEVEQIEAAATGSPMKMEDLMAGSPDGLAREIKADLRVLDEFTGDTRTLKEGLGLEQEEKAVAASKLRADLVKRPDIDNVEVLKWDDEGVTVSYDRMSTAGTKIESITEKVAYQVDDVTGGFKQSKLSGVGKVGKHLFSPNFLFNAAKEKLVDSFTRIMFASDIHRARFNKALGEVIQPIKGNKESVAKLDHILLYGDEVSENFTYADLVVHGVDGIRLSEKEFRVYVGMRHMMDKAFVLKNKEMREVLTSQGLKNVVVRGRDETLKTSESLQAANASVRNSVHKTAYVEVPIKKKHGNVLELTPERLQEYYDRGYVLARTAKDQFYRVGKDDHTKFVLVRSGDISDLPYTVLKKKKGYIPREYKDGFYFVKTAQRGLVDGSNTIVGWKTDRVFSSRLEADNFAVLQRESMALEGDKIKDVRVLHDRQILAADFDKEVVGMHGGLYSGARRGDALLFGIDGVKGSRVNALDSISKYFTHLSSRMPMAKYRLGIMRRWINEAKQSDALPANWKGDFLSAMEDVEKHAKDIDPTIRDFLRKSHEQIQFQLRVPTVGEKEVGWTAIKAIEWIEQKNWFGKFQPQVLKAMHRFDHKDPLSAIRSATFHAYLGVFNPVQTVVQGMGATIAMSVDPQFAIKALGKTFYMQTMDNIHNPNMLKLHSRQIAGKMGDSSAEEMYKLWRKTGLHESVIASNADLYSMAKSMPIGKGQIRRMFESTKGGSLFFFKAGELFNRRFSFATAFEWWKKANPGKKITASAEKAILDRANMYMLKMSRGNKARYQKGALSVPTQFFQVHSKFAELVLGKELTQTERMRLLLGQATIFGTAGIPFLSMVADNIVDAGGVDLTEENAVRIRGGLVHEIVQNLLGMNVQVANRGAIGKGIEDTIISIVTKKDYTHTMLLGPTGGKLDKSLQAVQDLYNFGAMQINHGEELPKDVWKAAIDSVLDIASSWDHWSKTYEAHNNKLLHASDGTIAKNLHGENIQTYMAMAFGFRHRDLDNAYLLNMADQRIKKRVENKARAFVTLYLKVQNGDPEHDTQYLSAAYASMLGSEDHFTRRAIGEAILRKLGKLETKEDQVLKSILTNQFKGLHDPEMASNPLLNRFKEHKE